MGRTAGEEGVVGWGGQGFSLTSLKGRVYSRIWEPMFKREVQAGIIPLGVINIEMVFKAMTLDGVTWRVR